MSKRCKNCGWINDDSSIKCQKCSASLSDSSPRPTSYLAPNESSDGMRGTVLESGRFDERQDFRAAQAVRPLQCLQCGYPMREGMNVCPNCGTPLVPMVKDEGNMGGKKCPNCGTMNSEESKFCHHCGTALNVIETIKVEADSNSSKSHFATVNPWMRPQEKPQEKAFCTLKPIAWEGENVTLQPISFTGNSIVLNRENTDPDNPSITSAEQAVLTFEDGEWYIIDKSAQRTTFVQASRNTRLDKGDIILIGNRLFEFNW